MQSIYKDNIVRICRILNSKDVKYLIIGGTAVALHGFFRMSININGQVADKPDIDFWYNPSYSNYFNLLNALQDFGLDVKAFKAEKSPNPKKSFFKFEEAYFTLDFLPIIGDDKFTQVFTRSKIIKIDKVDIYFLGYDDLIANKLKTARPKDLADIEQLNQINKRHSES